MITVNFMPKARVLAAGRRRRIRRWSLVCVGYGLILASAWAAAAAGTGGGEGPENELSGLQAKIAARDADLARLRKDQAGTNRRLEAARAVAEHPDWSILLRLLAELRGPEVALDRVALTPRPGKGAGEGPGRGGATVALGGIALTPKAASEFVMRMESNGLFETVTLLEVRSRPGGAGGTPTLTSFGVVATLADTLTDGGKK